jgi:hypothetical protein
MREKFPVPKNERVQTPAEILQAAKETVARIAREEDENPDE